MVPNDNNVYGHGISRERVLQMCQPQQLHLCNADGRGHASLQALVTSIRTSSLANSGGNDGLDVCVGIFDFMMMWVAGPEKQNATPGRKKPNLRHNSRLVVDMLRMMK